MKLLLRLVGLVIVIFITIVATILGRAHFQTRRIAPDLPTAEDILAFHAYGEQASTLSYVVTSSQQFLDRWLGHASFLARWQDGRILIVDTGMDEDGARDFAKLMTRIYGPSELKIFGDVANLLADSLQNVRGVAFTHLHIDHTQGVDSFCKAFEKIEGKAVLVSQTQTQKNVHNFNTKRGASIVENSCLQAADLTAGKILSVDEFPGLGIIPAGGHTPGSTIYTFKVDDHIWILSGDTTNSKQDLLENKGKAFVYSYVLVPENTKQTKKLRLWLAGLDAREDMTVIVSHDLVTLRQSALPEFRND